MSIKGSQIAQAVDFPKDKPSGNVLGVSNSSVVRGKEASCAFAKKGRVAIDTSLAPRNEVSMLRRFGKRWVANYRMWAFFFGTLRANSNRFLSWKYFSNPNGDAAVGLAMKGTPVIL